MIRITKSQSTKEVVTKTKTAILSGLVLVFLLAACGNNKSFNSAAWLKGDMRARGRMCEDLVRSKRLIGQTDAEARRLLGPPDEVYARVSPTKLIWVGLLRIPNTTDSKYTSTKTAMYEK